MKGLVFALFLSFFGAIFCFWSYSQTGVAFQLAMGAVCAVCVVWNLTTMASL